MAGDESLLRLPGEGRTLGAGANVITYKLAGAETRGAFSVLERVVPPHFQSPPQAHTNTREDWAAYVLDGALVFQLEDREVAAPAGSLVFVPRGVFFRWWNPKSEPAKCLMIYAPAGFEEYFSEVTEATKNAPGGPLDYERTLPTILRIRTNAACGAATDVMTTSLSCGCHCGNITVVFESEVAPEQIGVGADQCSFCRKHGARTITDPKGRVKITVRAADDLIRYRFGLKTADYLICGRCGVYVAAVLAEHESSYATVSINTFESSERFTQPPVPVSYDGETETARRARRREKWTPAVLIIEGGVPPAS